MTARTTPTLKKLVGLAQGVVQEVGRKKNPALQIPLRTLANVTFNEKKSIIELGRGTQSRQFFNVSMAKRFMQTFLVANACKELIRQGKTTSIRDLYYMTKHTIGDSTENTFDEQEESDPIIEDLEVTINALREELNLFASSKGGLVGEITLLDGGDTIDCRRLGTGGWQIPSITEPEVIQFKKCTAKFVLLVEKDAVWRRLNEDKFWRDHKCILAHGQGMAPRGVRRLVYRLNAELGLPVYVLVDNDPWGFYIYSVLKQGSINLAYESIRMAIPAARFIGLSSFDAVKFKLDKVHLIKLAQEDISRAKQILEYPWFQKKPWQEEIKQMLATGVKYELEAFSSKGISFITQTYLPRKLKEKDWLD
jgi:DNA topoisomerase-6 subunit A